MASAEARIFRLVLPPRECGGFHRTYWFTGILMIFFWIA
jgi:hypothetical protein